MALTKIRGLTQIMENSIYDINIADNAQIQTHKLKDGSNIAFLDGSREFTGNINLGNHRITNVAPGEDPNDVVTKAQLDAYAQGIDFKESVRAATVPGLNIDLSTGGLLTIDGVNLEEGDRVLVKDQTDATENGIYVASSGAWKRADDFNSNADVSPGAFCFVEEGEINANTGWVLSTKGTITLGTTELKFTKFTGLGEVKAGNGLYKVNDTLNVGEGQGIQVDADSISVKLADTSLTITTDGLTINTSGVKTNHLQDGAVTANKLNSDVVGKGLTRDNNNALAVNPDNDTLKISSNNKLFVNRVPASIIDANATSSQILIANQNGIFSAKSISGDIELDETGKVTIKNIFWEEHYIVRETPSGSIDGMNKTFTLAHIPIEGSEMVFLNGMLLNAGETEDYTISGKTITLNFAPETGSKLLVTYIKQ